MIQKHERISPAGEDGAIPPNDDMSRASKTASGQNPLNPVKH